VGVPKKTQQVFFGYVPGFLKPEHNSHNNEKK